MESRGIGAFELLYRANFGSVFRVCLLACRDASVAEEAAQEAFARGLEHWSKLENKPWAVGWIARTGMNFARRSMKRTPATVIPETAADSSSELRLDLHRAMASLPRRQQEAFILHYVVDLPVSDVAAAMGCREGTAKAHLFRARGALQVLMKEAEDE